MEIPDEILVAAEEAMGDLCPMKSKERYEKEFSVIKSWMKKKKVETINETVLLAYFNELSKEYKCSSLWSKYSMIKKMLLIKENVNISAYHKLIAFIKNKSIGHEAKKALVLSKDNILKFIIEAPDCTYLMIKVALLFGIYGACRREELTNIQVDDIEDRGSVLLVTIPKTKTNKKRQFGIVDDEISALTIYRKYVALRPGNLTLRRFFLQFRNNICTSQPVGKNTFGAISKTIAKYLQLSNPERYTGHTFRRTSATLLADSGADITTIKRHGGWKSSSVAEGYLEDSVSLKTKTAKLILNTDTGLSSSISSYMNIAAVTNNEEIETNNLNIQLNKSAGGISFCNLTNCTFNINK